MLVKGKTIAEQESGKSRVFTKVPEFLYRFTIEAVKNAGIEEVLKGYILQEEGFGVLQLMSFSELLDIIYTVNADNKWYYLIPSANTNDTIQFIEKRCKQFDSLHDSTRRYLLALALSEVGMNFEDKEQGGERTEIPAKECLVQGVPDMSELDKPIKNAVKGMGRVFGGKE